MKRTDPAAGLALNGALLMLAGLLAGPGRHGMAATLWFSVTEKPVATRPEFKRGRLLS